MGSAWQGKVNKQRGEAAEQIAEFALRAYGIDTIHQIHTGWKVVEWIDRRRNVAVVVPFKRVSGDRFARNPNTGQMILIEVKSHDADTLPYSFLKSHQHDALKESVQEGGVSLLVWVCYHDVFVLDYGQMMDDFRPRTSLKRETCERLYEWQGVIDERQKYDEGGC
jgi:penicillin-binding protein-related factor A (putative recombinase)